MAAAFLSPPAIIPQSLVPEPPPYQIILCKAPRDSQNCSSAAASLLQSAAMRVDDSMLFRPLLWYLLRPLVTWVLLLPHQ